MMPNVSALRSIVLLPTVESTNQYLHRSASDLPSGTLVIASRQYAGRGQKGNSWVMHDGDLAFSLLYRPSIPLPLHYFFSVVEAVSLSLVQKLSAHGLSVEIKWPNDLLLHGRKFSGILVESSTRSAGIHTLIVGVGINLTPFYENAPGFRWPATSLHGLLPSDLTPLALAMDLSERMLSYFARVERGEYQQIHENYLKNLYRKEGLYPFVEEGDRFYARIVTVQPDGRLMLSQENGMERGFLFKQVQFLPEGIATFALND